ncbi:MAG: hypothetical protein GXO07_00960 [Crenarchaeota archaeon]|nr:hypothetical protein [Thermoproteota archaeon]
MSAVEKRLGPLKAIFDGPRVIVVNDSEEPVFVEKLVLEYYYTVYMPDGRAVRRRGEEVVLEKKELKPGESLRFDMEVEVVGAKALILEGTQLKSYEVVIK